MTQLVRAFGFSVPLLLLCAPVVVALTAGAMWIPVRTNRELRDGFRSRLVLNSLMVLWLCGLAMITLSSTTHVDQRPVDLVPLREVFGFLTDSVSWQVPVPQIGGNIALFLPIGVLLELRWGRGLARTTIVGTSVAVMIEASQHISASGRAATLDDVGLAVLGTLLGAVTGRLILARHHGLVRTVGADPAPRPRRVEADSVGRGADTKR